MLHNDTSARILDLIASASLGAVLTITLLVIMG